MPQSVIGSPSPSVSSADTAARRFAYRDELRRILPPSPAWEAWLDASGELPPDFDALPSVPGLPDPLAGVSSTAQWPQKREETLALFHQWVLGTVPPAPPPDEVSAQVLGETKERGGARTRQIRLSFGHDGQATLHVELLIPPGNGPFPVFLTQHNHRPWALLALRRGYLGCVYAASDSQDDSDTFVAAFPDYDWSRLTRRAWGACRCVDYLHTLSEADAARIVVAGHSRNGKQSLMASAMDERIACVISSSSGAGGSLPARLHNESHFNEGIEKLTRRFPDWFHPRLRFFSGREDRLPVDMHQLIALSAPRPCLLSSAENDGVESAWPLERTYESVRRVYDFLCRPDALRLLYRPGSHETTPHDIERYLDWCDAQFGRPTAPLPPEDFLTPRSTEARESPLVPLPAPAPDDLSDLDVNSRAAWEAQRLRVREAIGTVLGEEPPGAFNQGGSYGQEPPHVAALLNRPAPSPEEAYEKEQIVFGEYINADVYLPAGLKERGDKAPAVLWLHPFAPAQGYRAQYYDGTPFYQGMVQQGFVVVCFDQIGFGRRLREAVGFYDRFPRWSLLGKMVRDAQFLLDMALDLSYVDATRVIGVGYGLGSLVGLHIGALDERLTGFVAIAGPPPLRLQKGENGVAARWSRDYPLVPSWEHFIGRENHLPYDLHHLLASFAPRPCLAVSPLVDWENPVEAAAKGIDAARRVYGLYGSDTGVSLAHITPESINALSPSVQTIVFDWLKEKAGLP